MFAAFRLLPIGIQVALGLGVLTAIGGGYAVWHHKIYQSGYDAAMSDVAEQNQEAVHAADQARGRVRDCNSRDGMRWNQVTRECERRD